MGEAVGGEGSMVLGLEKYDSLIRKCAEETLQKTFKGMCVEGLKPVNQYG